jgi:hypothetical protein
MRVTTRAPHVWQFIGWAVVGGLGCLGLLTAPTIGPFVLGCALIGAAVLVLAGAVNASALGACSGLGLPLCYVAWLNREGPGEVCHSIHNGQECTQQWSPWPWAAAGVVLIALGIGLFRIATRDAPRGTAP